MTLASRSVVGRLYVRAAKEPAPTGLRGLWPQGRWRQVGPLGPSLREPPEGERLLIVDVAASNADALLSDQTPWRVDQIHFRGWAQPPRRWLEDLPKLGPSRLVMDVVPASEHLSALAGVTTLETLRLDTGRDIGQYDLSDLAFLGQLRQLRALCLRGILLRGRPGDTPLTLETLHCSARSRAFSSSELQEDMSWVDVMPELRSLDLGLLEIGIRHFEAFARARQLRSLSLNYGEVYLRDPEDWRLLAGIRELELTRNSLAKVGLRGIHHAGALEALALEDVEVDEARMREIASLPALQRLELKAGILSGPVGLLRDLDLRVLNLRGAELEGAPLEDLRALRSLRTLNLHGVPIDDATFEGVMEFPELEVLVLQDSDELTLAGQLREGSLQKLRVLDLCLTGVATEELRLLARLPRLEMLLAVSLWGAQIDGSFEFGPALHTLSLDRTRLMPEGVAAIARAPRLRELSLAGCRIPLEELDPLRHLSTLRVLSAPVRSRVPAWIAELPRLEELSLAAMEPPAQDLSALQGCGSLTRLTLHGFNLEGVTERSWVIPPCPALEELSFYTCRGLSPAILGQLKGLDPRELDLLSSPLPPGLLAQLDCPSLESLKLYQTGARLEDLFALPDLPRLDDLRGLSDNITLQGRHALYLRFAA